MTKFSEWLVKREARQDETMTSTGDVANFARPLQFNDDNKKKSSVLRRRSPKIDEENK